MAKIRVYYEAINRGAQGIVNAWLVMHPKATLDDLRKAFPNSANPSMPPKLKELFRDPETAKQLRKKVGFGYIDKTNDIMKLQDGSQIVIVSMWSPWAFDVIQIYAAQYDIEVAEGYDKAKDTEGKGWYHEYLNGYVPPKPEPVSEIRTDAQGSTPANTQETQSADDKLDESNNSQEAGSGVEVDDIIIEEDENGYRIDTRGAVDRDDYDGVWERLEAGVPLSTPDHMVVNIAFRQLGEDAADTIESQAEEWYTFFLVENVCKGDATPPDSSPTRKLYYIHVDDSWSNSRNMDELLSHLEGKSYQDRDEEDIIGVRVYQGEIIRPRNMPHGGWYPDEAIFHHDYIWSALQQEGKTGFFGNNKACLRQDPPRFFEYVQGSGTPGEVNFYINGKLVDTITVDKDYCTQPLPPQRFRHFPLNPDVWEASMKKNEPDEENQVNISIRAISLDQLADTARAYWDWELRRGDPERGVFAIIETDDDDAEPPCCIFNAPVNVALNDGIRLALGYYDNNLTIKLGFIDAKGRDGDSSLAALLAYRRFRDGKLFLFSELEEDSIDMLDYDGLTVNIFNYDNPESDTPTRTDTIYVKVDRDHWDITDVPPKPEPVSEIRTDAQGSTPANTQETQSAGDKLDDIIIEEDENGYRIDTRGVVDRDDYDGVWERLEAEVPLSTPDHMVVNIAFRQLGEDAADTIESEAEEWYTFFLVENVYKGDATPPDNSPTRKLYYIHVDDSWSNSRNINDLLSHLEGKSYQNRDEGDIIGVRVYQGEIIRPRNMPHGGWYPDEAIFHHDYIWSALQQEGKTGFFGNNKACLRQDPPRFFEYVQGSGTPGEVNFYINGKLVDTITVDKDYCTQPLPPQRFRHFPLNPDVWEASMKKNEPDEENQVNISIRTISLDQLADTAHDCWRGGRGLFSRGVFAVIETNDDDAMYPCCIFNDPANTVLNDGIRLALTYLPDDDNNLTIRLGFIDAKGHDPDSTLAALLAYRRFRDGKLFLFSGSDEDSIDMLDYDGLTVNIFNYDNPESDIPTLTDTIYVEVDGDYWDIVV